MAGCAKKQRSGRTTAKAGDKTSSGAVPAPAKATIRVNKHYSTAGKSPAPAKGTRAVRVSDGAVKLALAVARVPPPKKEFGTAVGVDDVHGAGAGLPPSPNPFAPLADLNEEEE